MQDWNEFQPVGKWTASVTLYKDGQIMAVMDLDQVDVVETGPGDLDPETGLPVAAAHRLALSGVIREEEG